MGALAFLLVAFFLLTTVLYFITGNYLFSIFLLIFICYETPAPFLYFNDYQGTVQAQHAFETRATPDEVSCYLFLLILLFLAVNTGYLISERFFSKRIKSTNLSFASAERGFNYVVVFLLFCGMAAFHFNAGATRILDYSGEAFPTTPFFSYGILLLPVVVAAVYASAYIKKWPNAIVMLLGTAPLIYEIFISSRRQYLAPSLLVIVLLILYNKNKAKAASILSIMLVVSTVFFGLQFYVRDDQGYHSSNKSLLELIIDPQLGEFIAIGTTSFEAFKKYFVNDFEVTCGVQWLYSIVNSVPYIKFGDYMFPSYQVEMSDILLDIAPFGGLSLIADIAMGTGFWGLPVFFLVAGIFLRFLHQRLSCFFSRGPALTLKSTFYLALASSLLLKYRSGLGDMINTAINFTVLYFVVVGASFYTATRLKARLAACKSL